MSEKTPKTLGAHYRAFCELSELYPSSGCRAPRAVAEQGQEDLAQADLEALQVELHCGSAVSYPKYKHRQLLQSKTKQ